MADSSVFTTDLGAVTAYADAKAHGYTGTREEFATLLANAGNNLAEANAAKAAAQASATQAGQSANAAAASATLTLPGEGWAKNLQADERVPQLQITKEVGGSSSTYLADYFYINKSGTRIVLRGSDSYYGDPVGAFYVGLNGDASWSWWNCSADLSIPG